MALGDTHVNRAEFQTETLPVRKLPFVWFTLACLAGYCVLFGAIMVSHSGLGALLSSTFIGYGVIFFGSSATAVTAFYLIAFQEFWGTKSSD